MISPPKLLEALPVYLVHFEFDPEMPELLNLPLCDSCGLQAALAARWSWDGGWSGVGGRPNTLDAVRWVDFGRSQVLIQSLGVRKSHFLKAGFMISFEVRCPSI